MSCAQPCLVHFRLSQDDDTDVGSSDNDGLMHVGSDNETDSIGLGSIPSKRKSEKDSARARSRVRGGKDSSDQVANRGRASDSRTASGSQDSESDWADAFLPNKTANLPKKDLLRQECGSKDDCNEDDGEDDDEDDDFTFTRSKPGSKNSSRQKKAVPKKASAKSKPEPPVALKYRGLGQKILIFAHHKDVMDSIDDLLQEEGVQFVRIDGGTSMASRTKLVETFQTDDDTLVALLSIKVCGTGMNLTRANAALFAELDWTPGQMQQAEDRIHRLGQRR
jgi:SNF2 family DNA or RNA helicase